MVTPLIETNIYQQLFLPTVNLRTVPRILAFSAFVWPRCLRPHGNITVVYQEQITLELKKVPQYVHKLKNSKQMVRDLAQTNLYKAGQYTTIKWPAERH